MRKHKIGIYIAVMPEVKAEIIDLAKTEGKTITQVILEGIELKKLKN